MGEFRMPSLGADMEKGALSLWLVEPGSRVRKGDIIAEVETDKGIIQIEVYEDGIVDQILVQPGVEVPVGAVLATIRPEGAAEAKEVLKPVEGKAGEIPPVTAGERIKVSPAARRKAEEAGIDLDAVKGTGPEGSITIADVELAAKELPEHEVAPAMPAKAKPSGGIDPAGMRRAIAAAMSRSNKEIPHYYLETQVDMKRTLDWLEIENSRRPVEGRILAVALLVKAVALALKDVPELNGFWLDDRHQQKDAVNVGFAICLKKGGLFVPAIFDADKKDLGGLMAAMSDLIVRTRAGRLKGSELTEATVTVTSLGDLGVESVYGVIYPPQVAIVGFGKIIERPWAENGMLGVRPVVTATLAGDHRATDAAVGARFLDSLRSHLQEPEKL